MAEGAENQEKSLAKEVRLIGSYKKLWSPERTASIPTSAIIALFLISVAIPILISLYPVNAMLGMIGIGVMGFIAVMILFFDVYKFALFAFPFMFLVPYHNVTLGMSILLTVSYVSASLQSGRMSISIPHLLPLAIYLLAGFNGMTRAVDQSMGMYLFRFNVLIPAVMFVVFYNLKPSVKEIKTFLAVVMALTSLVGWLSFARYFVVGWTREIIGWSSNPAAFFLGMLVPVALFSLLDAHRSLEKVFWWIVIMGIFAGIFVTQSRAIYLSVFIGVAFLSFKDRRVFRVVAPIILGIFLIAPVLLIYRMAMMFGVSEEVDWSSVGRVQIWLNSITLIPKYFLTGMGIDSFRHIYPANFPMGFISAEHPHNFYLKMLFEYGIFGLVSFLWLVAGILKPALMRIFSRKRDISDEKDRMIIALTTGVTTALIASMVDAPFHHSRLVILLWIILAFIAVLTRPEVTNQAGE